jgi:PIN domain nuclease of toxin-antitoxin system
VIVLDTHVLVWWVNGGEELTASSKEAINQELSSSAGEILISSITAWEIALLVDKERLSLTMHINDWFAVVGEIEEVRFVPVDNDLAIQSVTLPGEFHKDPADRLITALARRHSVPLITADTKIRNYRHVKTIW